MCGPYPKATCTRGLRSAICDDIADRHDLDDTADHSLVGAVSLRFIYRGLIAEHAGHADILVEQIRVSPRRVTHH